MPKSKSAAIADEITRRIQSILASEFFKDWRRQQTILPGDLVIFNNSFLFRGKANTSKSDLYLGVRFGENSRTEAEPVILHRPGAMVNEVKRISGKMADQIESTKLLDEIRAAQNQLGPIVLSLVGGIGKDEPASVSATDLGPVKNLDFLPEQAEVAVLQGDSISLNQLDNSELIWESARVTLRDAGVGDDELEQTFRSALNALRNAAHIPVMVNEIAPDKPTVLGRVIERLERQVRDYSTALTRYRGNLSDSEARNELLRIAYNFADGAQGLTGLITGISDLKPLILWLTIDSQLMLALAFKRIPFSSGDKKISFDKYRTSIANARNHAFHDIFALGRTFKAKLPDNAFSGAEMLLFRDYSARRTSALDYDDRRIVELLEALTRTSEQAVPMQFWGENEEVMRCTVNIAKSLKSALILLGQQR